VGIFDRPKGGDIETYRAAQEDQAEVETAIAVTLANAKAHAKDGVRALITRRNTDNEQD
jgi:hypothetical protein